MGRQDRDEWSVWIHRHTTWRHFLHQVCRLARVIRMRFVKVYLCFKNILKLYKKMGISTVNIFPRAIKEPFENCWFYKKSQI